MPTAMTIQSTYPVDTILHHNAPLASSQSIHSPQHAFTAPHTISDLFPYQELFLRVLSFLPPTDLALAQGVSKYWALMSLDPQVSFRFSFSCLLANVPCIRYTEQFGFFHVFSYGNDYISVSPIYTHGRMIQTYRTRSQI